MTESGIEARMLHNCFFAINCSPSLGDKPDPEKSSPIYLKVYCKDLVILASASTVVLPCMLRICTIASAKSFIDFVG